MVYDHSVWGLNRINTTLRNISNYNRELYSSNAATLISADITFDPNMTLSFQQERTLLVAFAILKAPDNWLFSNDTWTTVDWLVATECGLYVCAKAYKSESYNNILKEETVGSWAIKELSPYKVDYATRYVSGGHVLDAWVEAAGSSLKDYLVLRTDLQLLIPADESQNFLVFMQRSFNVTHAFMRNTMLEEERYDGIPNE
ncbi:hypothetical protein BU25DRAFT_133223 [Macroventuria anomochaeta]|uniref:Uncharacterized protein n=1 Tax=Macroventuria anomochaeta TaxID=301207 RepID=A0ACB6RTW7_9PLEO|nr:uncharacterized protein BU25DRAFT_133223 [Macroventuria anomochaeta]KAF2624732.1 hypothetical protein BU25DRAFT_133223 [Macroventuria anomochaeta]